LISRKGLDEGKTKGGALGKRINKGGGEENHLPGGEFQYLKLQVNEKPIRNRGEKRKFGEEKETDISVSLNRHRKVLYLLAF